jgi:phosphohistidine phosphatase
MRTVYLLRHAKSEWANEHLSDIDRPLNARGYRDAHEMSMRLKASGKIPDLIVASAAIRTMSTALIFARNLGYDASKIMIRPDMYESNVKHYLSIIHSFDKAVNTVLMVGHNPTITDTANALTTPFKYDFPTCAIVGLQSKVAEWAQFKTGAEILYDYPKSQ